MHKFDTSIDAIVDYIKENKKDELIVLKATYRLAEIVQKQNFDITLKENQNFVLELMQHFDHDNRIELNLIKIFESSVSQAVNKSIEKEGKTEKPVLQIEESFLEKFFQVFLVKTKYKFFRNRNKIFNLILIYKKHDQSKDFQMYSMMATINLSYFGIKLKFPKINLITKIHF